MGSTAASLGDDSSIYMSKESAKQTNQDCRVQRLFYETRACKEGSSPLASMTLQLTAQVHLNRRVKLILHPALEMYTAEY
jgi:hypothetical protein